LILVERGVVRLSATRFQVPTNLFLVYCRGSSESNATAEKNSTKKRKTTNDLATLTVLRILEEMRRHQILNLQDPALSHSAFTENWGWNPFDKCQ